MLLSFPVELRLLWSVLCALHVFGSVYLHDGLRHGVTT
jgi:hypothetical protein